MTFMQPVLSYINTLTLRERLLFLFVFTAIIYTVWDTLFFTNHNKHQQQLHSEQQNIEQQQQQLSDDLNILTAQLTNEPDPNTKIRQDIALAAQQLEETNVQVNNTLKKLVPPTKITELLRGLLTQTSGLTLISLENQPVRVITLNQAEKDSTSEVQDDTHLFEHATTIKFTGQYQQLYQYLLALESTPWELFWDELDYKVTDYPNAEITLKVHTISTSEHWMGL